MLRGETDHLVDAGLVEEAVIGVAAHARAAVTAVDAQRLVVRLRESPDVLTADIVPAESPTTVLIGAGGPELGPDQGRMLRLPIGARQWRQELRVVLADESSASVVRPVAEEIAAAVDRALGRACHAVPPPPAGGPPLLRALTEGARAVILTIDPARGWSALSDSFSTVLGYDRTSPPDRRLIDLVHPQDQPAAVATFLRCCTGRHPVEAIDLRIRAADGGWRTLEVAARSFVTEPGVGVVVFFGIDVTAARETATIARLERQRLAKLVETMVDGVLLLDDADRICLANAAARRLLDIGPEHGEDWSSVIRELGTRLVTDRSRLERLARSVRAEEPVVGDEVAFTDGRVLELDFIPISCDDRPEGMLVHLRDVTTRVAVRRGLEERSRGLEERNRALAEATALNNQFVATVSHELRGPLSSVVAFAHLLGDASAGLLSTDQRSYLDIIDRNANRLLRLIEDLLLLSRLESRTLELTPVPTRLPDLVGLAVSEREPVAVAAGIELCFESTAGPELLCDETRMHQVVDNLLNNALKFTPPGGTVRVRVTPHEQTWVVEVADSGVGVPAADLPRLFTAFYRGSNVGSSAVGRAVTPGTGLGLVVSRAIVELHGGVISVASTEGVGTTVTLSLPLRPARSGG